MIHVASFPLRRVHLCAVPSHKQEHPPRDFAMLLANLTDSGYFFGVIRAAQNVSALQRSDATEVTPNRDPKDERSKVPDIRR